MPQNANHTTRTPLHSSPTTPHTDSLQPLEIVRTLRDKSAYIFPPPLASTDETLPPPHPRPSVSRRQTTHPRLRLPLPLPFFSLPLLFLSLRPLLINIRLTAPCASPFSSASSRRVVLVIVVILQVDIDLRLLRRRDGPDRGVWDRRRGEPRILELAQWQSTLESPFQKREHTHEGLIRSSRTG